MKRNENLFVILHLEEDNGAVENMRLLLESLFSSKGVEISYRQALTQEGAHAFLDEKTPDLLILGAPFLQDETICDEVISHMWQNGGKGLILADVKKPTS